MLVSFFLSKLIRLTSLFAFTLLLNLFTLALTLFLPLMYDLIKLRPFLTGKPSNLSIPPEMFLHNLITMNILMKLLIPELVLGLQLHHRRVT